MPQTPATTRRKPPALRNGDTVGIVAPASNLNREMLKAGCNALQALGYKPFYFDSILERDLYFAGSLDRRVRELEEMFVRDDVRAIVCARGGYGSNYLLDKLDLEKIAAHPKIFVGYSDLTTLSTWFTDSANLVTFHGPMAMRDFAQKDGVELSSWKSALGASSDWSLSAEALSGAKALVEGSAEGILYGGCLSMLSSSLGTSYDIHTEGTILFIEDVATKPYQIDRMLMQLKLAGKFDQVRGIVFGEMLFCVQSKDQDYTLEEVIQRVVGDLGVPIVYGLRSGHVSRHNITLPIGIHASLRVDSKSIELRFLESATTADSAESQTGAA